MSGGGSGGESPVTLALADDALTRRAADLEWLLLDVDGVFTDGTLLYTANGEEIKAFHVRDGLAVGLAQQRRPQGRPPLRPRERRARSAAPSTCRST